MAAVLHPMPDDVSCPRFVGYFSNDWNVTLNRCDGHTVTLVRGIGGAAATRRVGGVELLASVKDTLATVHGAPR